MCPHHSAIFTSFGPGEGAEIQGGCLEEGTSAVRLTWQAEIGQPMRKGQQKVHPFLTSTAVSVAE